MWQSASIYRWHLPGDYTERHQDHQLIQDASSRPRRCSYKGSPLVQCAVCSPAGSKPLIGRTNDTLWIGCAIPISKVYNDKEGNFFAGRARRKSVLLTNPRRRGSSPPLPGDQQTKTSDTQNLAPIIGP